MTEGYRWADSLAVGNEEMDREHEYQISLVESLGAGLSDFGATPRACRKTLDALVDFTSVHFMAEEILESRSDPQPQGPGWEGVPLVRRAGMDDRYLLY